MIRIPLGTILGGIGMGFLKKKEVNRKKNNEQSRNFLLPSKSYSTELYMHLPVNLSSFTGWRYPHIPRLKGHPLLGRIPHITQDNGILNNLLTAGNLAEQHESGMCYYWLAHKLVLIITQPNHIHQLLIDHHKDAIRGSSFSMFRKFMGSNITVDLADEWKKKQTIYHDWLSKNSILAQHEQKMLKVINKYMTYLETHRNQVIDLKDFFNRYILEVLLSTVLLPEGYSSECVEQLLEYHDYVTREIFEYRNIFKWLLPSFLRRLIYQQSYNQIDQICSHMRNQLNEVLLQPNEKTIKTSNNFINSIYKLTEHSQDDALISDKNVFGDTCMMLLAGQDNNLATFQFLVKLLRANPSVETKLRSELQNQLKNKEFNLENINKISYLDNVLKETLRMYPPVAFIPRDVVKPFTIDRAPLTRGDIIIFSPFLTHHLVSVWEKPNEFIPERFEDKNKIQHQAYIPFGAGGHMCIGQRIAWQEIKLLVAAIYLTYTIQIENNSFELTLAQGSLKPKIKPLARFIPIME